MVKKYKTKPCEIEAVQWTGDNEQEIQIFTKGGSYITFLDEELRIRTLEGDMRADLGDYIIKGLKGEFYPCKPDIFEKKYANSEFFNFDGSLISVDEKSYNKAIEDFANFLHRKAKENHGIRLSEETRSWTHASIFDYVKEFKEEQLKKEQLKSEN